MTVTANTAHLDTRILVNEELHKLKVIHDYTGEDISPRWVECSLLKVADKISQDLITEVVAAREGCKRRDETITTLAQTLLSFRSQLRDADEEIERNKHYSDKQSREIADLRKGARGNVVLINKQNFSLGLTFSSAADAPPTLIYLDTYYHRSHNDSTDAFGRVKYYQA